MQACWFWVRLPGRTLPPAQPPPPVPHTCKPHRTEADVPALVADRGFPEEPCFCVETALKSFYLSLHAYNHFKVGGCVGGVCPSAV